jgi:hypothetical protein
VEQPVVSSPPPTFLPFGAAPAALDLDFEAESLPELVTAVLAACAVWPDGVEPDPGSFWRMPVGERIERLLGLARLGGDDTLWVQLRCANPACCEPVEVDLLIEEVLALSADDLEKHLAVEAGGRRVPIRRPTGADQLAWSRRGFRDEAEAARELAATLVVEEQGADLGDELVAAIQQALDEHDPLVSFQFSAVCPYCGEVWPYELDLVELLLAHFREAQARLMDELYTLAARYHWTEAEILAVPARRRAHYLELLAHEVRR